MTDDDDPWVALLAGGGTVYVFDKGDGRIADQVMLLDVAYPAEEPLVRHVRRSGLDRVTAALLLDGVEIVDCRKDGSQ